MRKAFSKTVYCCFIVWSADRGGIATKVCARVPKESRGRAAAGGGGGDRGRGWRRGWGERAGQIHININNLKTSCLDKLEVLLAFNGITTLPKQLALKLFMLM